MSDRAVVVCPSPHTFVTAGHPLGFPLSGSPSRVPPRGCCVRRRSLRAACWAERVAGRLVKFFESRGGSACLQQAHQKSSHTGQKSFAESGTYLRPPPRRGVRLRRALKPVPLPAHGRHSRPPFRGFLCPQALACWGVRAASGPVKFFGPRTGIARTQMGVQKQRSQAADKG